MLSSKPQTMRALFCQLTRSLRFSALLAMVLAAENLSTAAETNPPPRPNLLVILADDLGYSDLGCYGSEIATPNLDRLAKNGLRFTQFYNSSRCCPSRASLLTGLYPQPAGMGDMEGGRTPERGYEGRLTDRCATIPEVLKPAGYRSYMVGKWHLNANPNPIQRGFDEFYGMLGGFNTFWEENPHYTRLPADHPRRDYAPGKFYSTDVFGDYALDFLAQARKEPDHPWFMYLAFNAPHFPLHAPEADIAKYEKKYAQGWDNIRAQRFGRQLALGVIPTNAVLTPRSLVPANWANKNSPWRDQANPAWESLPADRRADLARRMAVYAAMIDRMDQNIGRVLADLQAHGQLDNTLIVFLSDNGACAEWDPFGFDQVSGPKNILHTGDDLKTVGGPTSYISYGSAWANTCNTPWRLYKHYGQEGGIATPTIVHWPAGMKRTGEVEATPTHFIDLMPTLLQIANATYPEPTKERPLQPLAGRSFLPTLRGEDMPGRQLFFEHEGHRAVREGRWKLVAISGQPWELYDIAKDRSEMHDLAATETEIVTRLSQAWDAWAEKSFVRRPGLATPDIAGKPLLVSCEVTATVREGVILAQGGNRQGYALWLADGKLHFGVRINGQLATVQSGELPAGPFRIQASLKRDGNMELSLNGQSVASGHASGLIPSQPSDALSVGEDTASPVGDYAAPFALQGKVSNVKVVTE